AGKFIACAIRANLSSLIIVSAWALKRITAGLSAPDKRALYWDTAARTYALGIVHPQDATPERQEISR
ncbi:MAG: hypothetical protein VXW58_07605, partial [Pseudomonadota bacterium]|nr:hypothetical protein [Pseudomonadota bacterium]